MITAFNVFGGLREYLVRFDNFNALSLFHYSWSPTHIHTHAHKTTRRNSETAPITKDDRKASMEKNFLTSDSIHICGHFHKTFAPNFTCKIICTCSALFFNSFVSNKRTFISIKLKLLWLHLHSHKTRFFRRHLRNNSKKYTHTHILRRRRANSCIRAAFAKRTDHLI